MATVEGEQYQPAPDFICIQNEVNHWDDSDQVSPEGISLPSEMGDTVISLRKTSKVAVAKEEVPVPLEPLQKQPQSAAPQREPHKNYHKEMQPAFEGLAGEKDVLESITEAASMLLAYEKEDSVTNEAFIPGQLSTAHTMGVNVAFFRERMQKRIDKFMAESTPPGSPCFQAKKWGEEFLEHGPKPKVNYRALINQQTAAHEQLEVVHARYQQLLSQCLDAVTEDLNKHASVGEYRDIGEYRLKKQLAKLIGMADPQDTDEVEEEHHSRLGITEATLLRRRSAQSQFDQLVQSMDCEGHGILRMDQIREACERDPELRAKMEVLAFNLALDPENRFVVDDDALNAEIQAELEALVGRLQTTEEGLVSRESLNQMSPRARKTLVKLGLPEVFAG